jgi:hypothetical protein
MVGRSAAQVRRAGRAVAWREPNAAALGDRALSRAGVPERSAGRRAGRAERAAPGEPAFAFMLAE